MANEMLTDIINELGTNFIAVNTDHEIMQNAIIRLPDEENMHTHAFCPKCHYWLFGEDIGVKYCPHCGTKLYWNSKKIDNFHTINYEFGIKRYKALIEWRNNNGERNAN